MFGLSSDLTENILTGLYVLFTHNALVIAYFLGLLISSTIALLRPTRLAMLASVGFAILVFSFEYDKHIIGALREQTLATIVGEAGSHKRVTRLINLIISELLPIFFFVLGWLTILFNFGYSLWIQGKKNGQPSKQLPE